MNKEVGAVRELVSFQAIKMLERTAERAQKVAESFNAQLIGILNERSEQPKNLESKNPLPSWPSYFNELRNINGALEEAISSLEDTLRRCEL